LGVALKALLDKIVKWEFGVKHNESKGSLHNSHEKTVFPMIQ